MTLDEFPPGFAPCVQMDKDQQRLLAFNQTTDTLTENHHAQLALQRLFQAFAPPNKMMSNLMVSPFLRRKQQTRLLISSQMPSMILSRWMGSTNRIPSRILTIPNLSLLKRPSPGLPLSFHYQIPTLEKQTNQNRPSLSEMKVPFSCHWKSLLHKTCISHNRQSTC